MCSGGAQPSRRDPFAWWRWRRRLILNAVKGPVEVDHPRRLKVTHHRRSVPAEHAPLQLRAPPAELSPEGGAEQTGQSRAGVARSLSRRR
jgi:hypothetical protein